jgi:hypothetical protein
VSTTQGSHPPAVGVRVRAFAVLAAVAGVASAVLLLTGGSSARADSETDCASPTVTYTDATMPDSLNLTAADVVVFASGTFTGSVNSSGAVICVDTAAAFNPSSLNGSARLFVRGEVTLPAIAAGSGASLDNEGTVTLLPQPNVNGVADVINRAGGTILVLSDLALGPGVSVTNDGTIEVTGSSNFGGVLVNSGDLTIDGLFVLTGSVTNNATMTVGMQTTIDSGASLTNLCRYTTDGMISNDTIVNAGVIDLTTGDFLHNGPATMTQTATGIMLGQDFTNTGTIAGAGQLQFGGVTSNQGTFAGDSAAAPIVFEDLTPTGDQTLDLELGTITNVVRAPVTVPGPDACGAVPPTTTTSSTSTSTSTTSTSTSTSTTSTSTSTSTSTTSTSTSTSTTSTTSTSTTLPTTTSTTTGPTSTDPSTTTTSSPAPAPGPTDPSNGGGVALTSGSGSPGGGALPRTGVEVTRLAVVGLLLVLAGTFLGRAVAVHRRGR